MTVEALSCFGGILSGEAAVNSQNEIAALKAQPGQRPAARHLPGRLSRESSI